MENQSTNISFRFQRSHNKNDIDLSKQNKKKRINQYFKDKQKQRNAKQLERRFQNLENFILNNHTEEITQTFNFEQELNKNSLEGLENIFVHDSEWIFDNNCFMQFYNYLFSNDINCLNKQIDILIKCLQQKSLLYIFTEQDILGQLLIFCDQLSIYDKELYENILLFIKTYCIEEDNFEYILDNDLLLEFLKCCLLKNVQFEEIVLEILDLFCNLNTNYVYTHFRYFLKSELLQGNSDSIMTILSLIKNDNSYYNEFQNILLASISNYIQESQYISSYLIERFLYTMEDLCFNVHDILEESLILDILQKLKDSHVYSDDIQEYVNNIEQNLNAEVSYSY